MSGTVYIRGLQVEAVIGIHARERRRPQPLLIDVEMQADTAAAAATDDIRHALDYDAVAKRLREFAAASSYQLVESLAEAMARLLQEEFAITRLHLRLGKPGALPDAKEAGVIIKRPAPSRESVAGGPVGSTHGA